MIPPKKTDRTEEVMTLLVKAADGELSETERVRFETLLAADPSLKEELGEMHLSQQSLAQLGLRDPNPDDWQKFERSLGPKVERSIGWLLMLVGYVMLVSVGLFYLFTDPEVPLVVKICVGAVASGFAVLLFQVGRRFARENRRDPYKHIIR